MGYEHFNTTLVTNEVAESSIKNLVPILRPRPTVNANMNVESLPSLPILVQDNDSQREEIDIVTSTDDVLPLGIENDDDSDREIDVVDDLRVDNSISNSEHKYSDD
nr:hypothetical protein [Tanacetum cinerariifolium]